MGKRLRGKKYPSASIERTSKFGVRITANYGYRTMTDNHDRLMESVKFLGHSMDNMPVFLAMAIVAALIHEPLQYRPEITVFLPCLLGILAEVAKRNAHRIK